MAKEMKIIADNIGKEKYDDFVNEYLKQLESENDITLFGKRYGSYYYIHKGLVHEIRWEESQIIEETYESWPIEEKNFVMNDLDDRIFI